jgi:NADPH-dependent 2,4-dienoyl-CoA reductase/sulfur reductase-like enzyme
MTAMLIEPARPIPIVAEPDVLVVGGGPAGVAAAWGAAQAGASVMVDFRTFQPQLI